MKSKRIWFSVATILILISIIFIGPINGFRHGHYVEEYYVKHIAPEDWQQQIPVENGVGYEMQFSPVKDFMNGFSIYYGLFLDIGNIMCLFITSEILKKKGIILAENDRSVVDRKDKNAIAR